ncbi:MAG: DegV family protein [Anaerostipes sp.]|uniref:DegV family protein n=1 Tax=Anaerostipes sp. 992a TaxID=1261637 RepID=UPI000952FFAC|nr:DegV family protein [Anaerostipes sp. 992a]MCI5952291.1 DegV family protein [Anaerostipes sp.]OLR62943.1 dihydroxyacetone kinase [Anaerostipes sp. 992a]
MKKVAIVTDSNSGITQSMAKDYGVFVLPMPFHINGKTFYEDITLSQDEFYEYLKGDADISTSQPSPGDVTDLWDKLLTSYDEIIHIPMSSGLSGSCQTAMMLAEDYENKVWVVNNQRISTTMKSSVLDAKAMADKGLSAEEIHKRLTDTKFDSSIYIMLDTLKYLKKGGRITPAAAALATLLKIKPVLQIQGEKLDAFAKCRTVKKGRSTMLDAAIKDSAERFGGIDNVRLNVVHTENPDAAIEFRKELSQAFPVTEEDIPIDVLSLSVACHIGPGCLAVTIEKKMEY